MGRLLRGQTAKSPCVAQWTTGIVGDDLGYARKKFLQSSAPIILPLENAQPRHPVWLQYSRRAVAGRFCSGWRPTQRRFLGLLKAICVRSKISCCFPVQKSPASIGTWPAVFFGKGLWDNYQSLEGSFEAYQHAAGLKEIVAVRRLTLKMNLGPKMSPT